MILYQIRFYQYDDLIIDELFTTYELALEYITKFKKDATTLDTKLEKMILRNEHSKPPRSDDFVNKLAYLEMLESFNETFSSYPIEDLIKEREIK